MKRFMLASLPVLGIVSISGQVSISSWVQSFIRYAVSSVMS